MVFIRLNLTNFIKMCTVTLTALPGVDSGFVLTSNRDEAIARETLPPEEYLEGGVRMLYPKDAVAGGTWIGVSGRKRAICLLNGAFEKHRRKPSYAKSRGVVVKDLLAADLLEQEISSCSLQEVEPFTCVIVEWSVQLRFFELVWDESKKHFRELPPGSYIWASSFLFSAEERQQRRKKFESLQQKYRLNRDILLNFHTSEEVDGMILDKGPLKTCSITQIANTPEGAEMFYRDLLRKEHPEYNYTFRI